MKTYNERTQDILQKAEAGKAKKMKTVKLTSIIASVCAVVLAFNLFMFVPYQTEGVNIDRYKTSEYYTVIKKVNDLTYGEVRKESNFQRLTKSLKEFFGSFTKGAGAEAPDGAAGAPPTITESPSYEEVTNNQTNGVIEGDLFKRSSEYAYYLDYGYAEYRLYVYPFDGTDTVKVAEFIISEKDNMSFAGYHNGREMFLSKDCSTVTVISPCYNRDSNILYTAVISIDVSDINNIKEINRTYISGSYVSSRIIDGELLLVSNFRVSYPDFSDKTQYLPHTGRPDGFTPLPVEDIICPDNASSANYTVVCSLNEKTLSINDCEAFMSFSDEVYVSENNLFVTRSYYYARTVSQIYCLAYGGGKLDVKGECEVDGTIINRYCMDEYEGVLRVFTDVNYVTPVSYKGANLYCIDLQNFDTVASVEQFTPNGESVRSARFDKDTAYVCTAVVNTDPVFAFDLSDYSDIKYKDTGTIPGYSISLMKFKDDTLLGIGYGDWVGDLKIELYRESESSVESVAIYHSVNTYFSTQFKAYFIDAQKGLIGLGIEKSNFAGYILLRFDGYNLVEVASAELREPYDYMRACTVDGYMYIYCQNELRVINVDNI